MLDLLVKINQIYYTLYHKNTDLKVLHNINLTSLNISPNSRFIIKKL